MSACKHNPYGPEPKNKVDDYGNYPVEIGKIFVNRCATAGCHNAASYTAAGSLRLDTWENLFNGGGNGAAIVPYSTEFSPLLYFINPDSSLGVVSEPRMPKDAAPLTKDEYLMIREWIAQGAPDKNGNVPFASNADSRQKIYLTQQGCDLLAAIDADKKVVMRYIKIGGDDGQIESPHSVKITKDGKYAYVCFSQGRYLQKIETSTDRVIGQLQLSPIASQWSALVLSPDDSKALVTNLTPNPAGMMLVDLNNMKLIQAFQNMSAPHGVATNKGFDTFFVTGQYGNIVYKFSKNGPIPTKISIDGNPASDASSRDPHEVLMAPDYSKYFLTCQKSNEIRVMDAHTDQLITTIPIGEFPQEMVFSKKYPYMFVSCKLGNSPYSIGNVIYQGSVYVINYQTNQIVTRIDNAFTQPHAVTVDDANDALYVASINPEGAGPAPHHVSSCVGKNGYYQIFDMKTFQKLPGARNRYEVTVAPYSSAIRFE